MKIIKLNAIASTNSFLKDLAQNSALENFTVVVAKEQTNGRGQQDSNWVSEPHKNLTVSIFIAFKDLKIIEKKYLNFAVSLAVYDVLFDKKIKNLSIKWPNDILSANKKICGILIENTFIGNRIKNSIIGIGLNVNQEVFSKSLTNVTSLKIENALKYNLDELLITVLTKLQQKITLLETKQFVVLEKRYLEVLYKKNIPTMFKNNRDEVFIGIISGISTNGNLQILLEDDSVKEFGIKEITIL